MGWWRKYQEAIGVVLVLVLMAVALMLGHG